MLPRLLSAAAALLLLTVPAPALAMSRLLVDGHATSARLSHVREAHVEGPTRTTVWMSAQIEGTPGHLAWVVSIPEGAALDVGATSWLDALESATAPRMLPPTSVPPDHACAIPPAPVTVTDGDADPVVEPSSVLVATTPSQVAKALSARQIELDPGSMAELSAASSAGERVVVLFFEPSRAEMSTVTLRVVSPVPMQLPGTHASSPMIDEASRVIWLLGSTRRTMASLGELSVEPPQIHWLTTSATDYAETRAGMLSAASPASAVNEIASQHALTSLTILPGNHVVPSAVDAYVERISARGEATSSPASTVNAIHEALATTGVLGEVCPRGDLVAAGFPCEPPASGSPELSLSASGVADDLAFALAGTGSRTWVTRFASFSPLTGTPAEAAGGQRSMARQTADPWATFCPHASPPPASGGGGVIVVPAPDPGVDDGEGAPVDSADLVQVTAESTGAFSCSGDENQSDDGGACGQSSDGSHDGCSCTGSSGSSEGSGCGGSGAEPSSGCGGGSSPSGSDCTIGPSGRGPRRIRIAKYGFLLALGALVARRSGRARAARPA